MINYSKNNKAQERKATSEDMIFIIIASIIVFLFGVCFAIFNQPPSKCNNFKQQECKCFCKNK